MQLDFKENINEYGESVVRLFDFGQSQAILFRDLIQEAIIDQNMKLSLSSIDFIESHNYNLIMGIGKTDEGIVTGDNQLFFCILTLKSYRKMIELLAPFCEKETKAYQFLYDVDTPIDLLFAPAGT